MLTALGKPRLVSRETPALLQLPSKRPQKLLVLVDDRSLAGLATLNVVIEVDKSFILAAKTTFFTDFCNILRCDLTITEKSIGSSPSSYICIFVQRDTFHE